MTSHPFSPLKMLLTTHLVNQIHSNNIPMNFPSSPLEWDVLHGSQDGGKVCLQVNAHGNPSLSSMQCDRQHAWHWDIQTEMMEAKPHHVIHTCERREWRMQKRNSTTHFIKQTAFQVNQATETYFHINVAGIQRTTPFRISNTAIPVWSKMTNIDTKV